MIKIMFVCHGNICRSPMAEFVFRHIAKEKGVSRLFSVASSASSREEIWDGIGSPIYPPVKRLLSQHGVAYNSEKRATLLTPDDLSSYDLIVAMDERNLREINGISHVGREKVHKLLDFTNNPRDVLDPWYTGDFDSTYRDVCEGCYAIIDFYLNKEKRL